MKSLALLRLGLRLSMIGTAGTGSLLLYSSLQNGMIYDGRDSAGHLTAAYFTTLAALLVLPHIRKSDVALLTAGGLSFVQIVLWAFRSNPFEADAGLAAWIAGLAGIIGAIIPAYVDNGRRNRREARRASDAILKARTFTPGNQ